MLQAAILKLGERMRADLWQVGPRQVSLERVMEDCDRRSRADGLHVRHDWDGKAGRINDDTIPVEVLMYVAARCTDDENDTGCLAILIDYYFLYVLTALAMRAWDESDANANLEAVGELLRELQGPGGSGQQFVSDVETLLLVATSHFEPREDGYGVLLTRVRQLNQAHQERVALGHASALGGHLRFGFEATYARDTTATRDDNVADYPWLCFSLAALMRAYASMDAASRPGPRGQVLAEAIFNGLSADPAALLSDPPASLSAVDDERRAFREQFLAHRTELLGHFATFRPVDAAYSPLAFFFNFSQNVTKGAVIDSLLWGLPGAVSLNDLFTGLPLDTVTSESRQKLAMTLMAYARSSPDRIRGRLMPVIVYDPVAGRRAHATAMEALSQ
jgi:hypothetical protein